MPQANTVPSV